MAVDTETKRRSVAGMLITALVIAPVPDDTVSAVDRMHVTAIYAGIAPSFPGVDTDSIHIYSEGRVEPNHVADSSNSILVAGEIEAQTGGYFGNGTNYSAISRTGVYTSAGEGRVWRKESMEAAGFKAPGLKPAELTETGLGFAWAFADDDDEIVLAHYMLPPDADTSVQPKMMLHWGCADNTGNAYWQIEYLWIALNQDLTNATPDDTIDATDAVSGTANGYTQTTAQLADLAAGDTMLHVRIKRLGTQGADTLTGDTFLHCACLLYVSNKLGTAT